MVDIKPLRYFIVLGETLHFGKAAARLHLTQPALSRQLAALEQVLGVRLIERTPRSVSLTAAGQRFHADARAILASLEQAWRNAKSAALGETGTLSIGFTMCAAYSVVPRYARSFATRWPGVGLRLHEVVSNDLARQVIDGRIDAAIMFPGSDDETLASRTILSEPLCVALSRDHPLARSRRAVGIAQLAGEPFVLAAEHVASPLRAAIIAHCRSGGFAPKIRMEVQLQQTVLSLVGEGVGVALVPTSMRKSQLAGVRFRPLANAPKVDQVLAWSRANRNPCLARFLDMAAAPASAPVPSRGAAR